MDTQSAIDLGREAILTAMTLALPILLVGLVLSLGLGFLQSLFQVHDQSVSYIPKVLLMIIAVALALPWMSDRLIDFSKQQLERPRLIFVQPLLPGKADETR